MRLPIPSWRKRSDFERFDGESSEITATERLIPEAAHLRSQEFIFEHSRNTTQIFWNDSQVSIVEPNLGPFADPSQQPSLQDEATTRRQQHLEENRSSWGSTVQASVYSNPFATPSSRSINRDSSLTIQDPRPTRPALSPRASSMNIETLGKTKDIYIHEKSDSQTCVQTGTTPVLSWKRPFTVAKKFFLAHIDPKTIWNMFDCTELFWPFTWKKYAVLLILSILIAGIVVSELYLRWMESAMEITRRNILGVLVVVIALEPAMITLMLLVARIPNITTGEEAKSAHEDIEAQNNTTHQEPKAADPNQRTALVIPCHNSDHTAFKRVMDSAFKHFHPSSIFIVDNARSMHPKSHDFRNFVHSLHPEINYIWSPIGSKNAAQLVGAVAAKNFEFIFTVDDDVCIPANFRAPVDKIDDVTKGVAFPLKATNADGDVPLFLVAWQDCEYRMAGLVKLAESDICGVLYPHGAGWFCERETMIDLISNYHSLDFIAEDVNTGISMQKMKKRIAFDASCVLETEVPTTFIGAGLNWYNQRVRSWEMGRHGRVLAFAGRMLFSFNGQTTLHGIFWQKFVHFYSLACIVVDWVRIPVLVTMGTNGAYWRQAGLLMLVSVFPVMAYNYLSCRRRPDMRTPFWGAVTIPIYKQIYALVSLVGAIRCVVYYIGGHNKPKTVRQMVDEKDERAFWLDPRFESNPAFLADKLQD